MAQLNTQQPYSKSFLNQLQTEWNEFLAEIGTDAATDIVKGGLLDLSDSKSIFKEKLIDSLNKFNCTSGKNIIIPVPLNTLKRFFSPSKCNADDSLKVDFFNEIKENLNLTNVTCKKLQRLLLSDSNVSDSSQNVSDFPSPSLPSNLRSSAPPRLLNKKPKPKIDRSKKPDNDENQLSQKTKIRTPPRTTVRKIDRDDKITLSNNRKILGSNEKERRRLREMINVKAPAKTQDCKSKDKLTVPSQAKEAQRSSDVYLKQDGRESSSLFIVERSQKKSVKPTIVCTYFSQDELIQIYQAVKKLGFFEIENNVSSRTTHLICGSSKKTVNLCKAVVRGCWILEKQWVTSSFQERRWLYEESFEMADLSPAVKINRLKHQTFGPVYECDIFKRFGSIFVSNDCAHPKATDIKELVTLAGGRLTDKPEKSKCIIGHLSDHECYKETWILNCIMQGRVVELSERFRIK